MDQASVAFGVLGGSFIFLPQLIQLVKTIKTKDASSLDNKNLVLYTLGGLSYTIYGGIKGDPTIAGMNVLLVLSQGFSSFLKWRYKE